MAPEEAHTVFHREANCWSIEHHGKVVRLARSHGLGVLAHLIENPGRRFRASDLLPLVQSKARKRPVKTNPDGRPNRASENDYRRRLRGLRAELRRARESNDRDAARNAEREMEAVTRELARAVGLSGSKPGGDAGRTVADAVAAAIAAVARSDRDLARYLGRTVSTGTVFSYTPDEA